MQEILIEIFKQCHEHLRETDKKRDQVIAFYLIIVGLIVGVLDKLEKYENIKHIALFIVGLTGIMALLTVLHYRKWHTIHTNTAVVFHHFLRSGTDISEEEIKSAWEKLIDKRGWRVLYPIGSVDASLFYAFIFISFFPLALIVNEGYGIIKLNSLWLALTGDFLLYLLISCTLAYKILNDAERKPDMNLWAFRTYRK